MVWLRHWRDLPIYSVSATESITMFYASTLAYMDGLSEIE